MTSTRGSRRGFRGLLVPLSLAALAACSSRPAAPKDAGGDGTNNDAGAAGGRAGATGGAAGARVDGGAGGAGGVSGGGGNGGGAGVGGGGRGGNGGAAGSAGTGGAAGAGGNGAGGGGGVTAGTGGAGVAGAGGDSGGGTGGVGGAGAGAVAGTVTAGAGGGAGATTATGGAGGTGSGGAAGAGTGGAPVAGTGGATVSCAPTTSGSGGITAGPLPDSITQLANVTVSTLAGGGPAGTDDGPPGLGKLGNPASVVLEPSGSLIVTDFDSERLRRVAADGTISTLTMQGNFHRPYGLAQVGATLYAQTDANPGGQRNLEAGTMWNVNRTSGLASVIAANIGRPRAFAPLADGRLVLSDYLNQRVRVLDPTNGALSELAGLVGCPGFVDGVGTGARFARPEGVVVLPGDRIVVADYDAHVLRLVTTAGAVSTFAGDGVAGTIDGPRDGGARFVGPRALAADGSGAVFVSDDVAHRIRRIAADGTVTTVAGNGTAGFMDGPGGTAMFFGQEGLAVTSDGATLFVADGSGGSEVPVPYHRIRKITIGP